MPGKADRAQDPPSLSGTDNGASHPGTFHNAMVMAYVNHQGASGRTRGHRGIALSVAYIPKRENVVADASLGVGLSRQNGPPPLVAKSLFQSTTGSWVCLSHSSGVGP